MYLLYYNMNKAIVGLTKMAITIWVTQECVVSPEYNSVASWINYCCRSPNDQYNLPNTKISQFPRYTQRGHQKYSLQIGNWNLQIGIYWRWLNNHIMCRNLFLSEPFEAQLHANFHSGGGHLCYPRSRCIFNDSFSCFSF